MKKIFGIVIVFSFCLVGVSFGGDLQSILDNAKPGSVIKLKKGVYKGGIVIKRTITLNCNGATIDGEGKGDVLTIKRAKNVVVENCVFRNSGSSGWRMDSGIKLVGTKKAVIKNNRIEKCLYGIVAKNAKGTVIEGNDIASKPYSEGVKGDAIRLWWSGNCKVIKNYIHDSRDVVSIFSNNVVFDGNRVKHSHIGTMIQNSNNNQILNFKGVDNEVNILLNSATNIKIKNFSIKNSGKFRGIVLIRASNTYVEDGIVKGCKKGIVINLSPAKSGTKNYIENIKLVSNKIGIYLHTTAEQRSRNIIKNITYIKNKTNLMDEWKTHEQ